MALNLLLGVELFSYFVEDVEVSESLFAVADRFLLPVERRADAELSSGSPGNGGTGAAVAKTLQTLLHSRFPPENLISPVAGRQGSH